MNNVKPKKKGGVGWWRFSRDLKKISHLNFPNKFFFVIPKFFYQPPPPFSSERKNFKMAGDWCRSWLIDEYISAEFLICVTNFFFFQITNFFFTLNSQIFGMLMTF